jgi:hypothetical protein
MIKTHVFFNFIDFQVRRTTRNEILATLNPQEGLHETNGAGKLFWKFFFLDFEKVSTMYIGDSFL